MRCPQQIIKRKILWSSLAPLAVVSRPDWSASQLEMFRQVRNCPHTLPGVLLTVGPTGEKHPFVLTTTACTTDFKCRQLARVAPPPPCLTFCLISLSLKILCGTKGKQQTREVFTSLFHILLMAFRARNPFESFTCVLWGIGG